MDHSRGFNHTNGNNNGTVNGHCRGIQGGYGSNHQGVDLGGYRSYTEMLLHSSPVRTEETYHPSAPYMFNNAPSYTGLNTPYQNNNYYHPAPLYNYNSPYYHASWPTPVPATYPIAGMPNYNRMYVGQNQIPRASLGVAVNVSIPSLASHVNVNLVPPSFQVNHFHNGSPYYNNDHSHTAHPPENNYMIVPAGEDERSRNSLAITLVGEDEVHPEEEGDDPEDGDGREESDEHDLVGSDGDVNEEEDVHTGHDGVASDSGVNEENINVLETGNDAQASNGVNVSETGHDTVAGEGGGAANDVDRYVPRTMITALQAGLEPMSPTLGWQILDPDTLTYEDLIRIQQRFCNDSVGIPEELIDRAFRMERAVSAGWSYRSSFDVRQLAAGNMGVSTGAGVCSICWDDFEEVEDMAVLRACNHPFHVNCIRSWLRKSNWCCLCGATAL